MYYTMLTLDSIPEITVAHYFTADHYDSGFRQMPGMEIMITERGSWQVEFQSEKVVYRSGEFSAFPQHILHRQTGQKEDGLYPAHYAVHFVFHGTCELIDELEFFKHIAAMKSSGTGNDHLYGKKIFLPVVMKVGDHDFLLEAMKKIVKEFASKKMYSKYASSILLQNVLLEISKLSIDAILHKEETITRTINDHVSRVIQFIGDNYNRFQNVEQMAKQLGLNASYLGTIFKKQMGITIPEYLCIIRVWRAKMLIESTKLSFKEISEKVGAGSYYYFSTIFKKHTGMTMSDYSRLMP